MTYSANTVFTSIALTARNIFLKSIICFIEKMSNIISFKDLTIDSFLLMVLILLSRCRKTNVMIEN